MTLYTQHKTVTGSIIPIPERNWKGNRTSVSAILPPWIPCPAQAKYPLKSPIPAMLHLPGPPSRPWYITHPSHVTPPGHTTSPKIPLPGHATSPKFPVPDMLFQQTVWEMFPAAAYFANAEHSQHARQCTNWQSDIDVYNHNKLLLFTLIIRLSSLWHLLNLITYFASFYRSLRLA